MAIKFKSAEDFTRWNEEMTRKYDSEDYHLRSNFLIRWIEGKRVKKIIELIDATPTDTILEVGCGAGLVLEKFQAKKLIGIDLSGYILHKTRARLAHREASLLQANAETLPFLSQSFHKIVCTEVIEHVIEPRNVIRELSRIATPDAIIVITIPNERLIDNLKRTLKAVGLSRLLLAGKKDPKSNQNAYDSPDEANEWHLHDFDINLIKKVTEDKLTIVQIQAIPFFFLPLRYVVFCKQPQK
ncbi:MAG: class I SAM-dependent methyltransferase [Chloroflexota bacterium]